MIYKMRKIIIGGNNGIQISKLTREVDVTVYNNEIKNEADICQDNNNSD